MNNTIVLTQEMTELIEESEQIFSQIEPLLPNGRENSDAIIKLNERRAEIDSKLGMLLRDVYKKS
ncbi:hypothetical protein [Vibrio lentus]|uniref:Uncharacterized protein n=1 Tax=Vibrio lentus TaxID=136468 RepID=A0A2N7C7H9_9VIBR|nr:hypothetical protein [Vibrio lentus]PME50993.1 hypothetical protein BCV34_10625 [Vibrio lentus]PME75531.1 hypothetical protein BCV30_00235 [Vibrio lentus]PME85066.1 hypothetical protein BCV27_10370 [Vibrio lentus]PMI12420.1 hypothetical protein BCU53_04670 [Vibrio lentus]PMJ15551.1 hypothetical protein BCU29_12950 [Vibrio lentus]